MRFRYFPDMTSFPEVLSLKNEIFILAGRLGTGLSFYEVETLS